MDLVDLLALCSGVPIHLSTMDLISCRSRTTESVTVQSGSVVFSDSRNPSCRRLVGSMSLLIAAD